MKPFQPRCPGAQIERKWPATKDYFSFGKEAIAFLAGPRAGGAWCQVACRGDGRPRFAKFPVIPAPGVGQFDRRIDCLNLRSIFGADALNTQDVDPLHGHLPKPFTRNRRIIVYRRHICNCRPLVAGGYNATSAPAVCRPLADVVGSAKSRSRNWTLARGGCDGLTTRRPQ